MSAGVQVTDRRSGLLRIRSRMLRDEIHSEIVGTLDAMAEHPGIPYAGRDVV